MKYGFVQLRSFSAEWRSHRLVDADLQALELLLMTDAMRGDSMGGGLRKIRFAAPSRHSGKSGAFRICYAVFPRRGLIALVTMFAKNQKANLAAAEARQIREYLKWFESTLPEAKEI